VGELATIILTAPPIPPGVAETAFGGLEAKVVRPFSSCDGVVAVAETVEAVDVEVVEGVEDTDVEEVEAAVAVWLLDPLVGEPDVGAAEAGEVALSDRPSRSDRLSLRARKGGMTNFGIGMVEQPQVEFAAWLHSSV